jgi:alginate O-acetyltransferase complex protein AlgI
MVFSSHLFLFYFLPLALGVYYALPRGGRHLALTLLSCVFYGWADPRFLLLLIGTTVVDYVMALAIAGASPWSKRPIAALPVGGDRSRFQRLAIMLSIVSNVGVLAFFKYFNFAADSYVRVAAMLGWGHEVVTPMRIVLPLGISFYTFQSLSYTIDVYRGHARATRNLIDLACFVSMFPQLVAGPIIRYSDVADQLASRTHTPTKFARGVAFFALGLAKKVLLANPCGTVADLLFDTPGIGAVDAWYGAVAYAFQIYFDFSGYSDMAVGLGLMMGFMFAKNFDSPYRSASITEFWRRWHLSLSTWLRDYLYVPLGGNRRGRGRTYGNIAIVMLIGGLWHGAAWTFVVWGGIHGALLIAERMRGRRPLLGDAVPRGVNVAVTFVLVTVAWVFFRAADLHSAMSYCRAMFGVGAHTEAATLVRGVVYQPYYLAMVLACAGVTWLSPQTWDFTRTLPTWKVAWATAMLWVAMLVLATQAYNPFIYFIF